MIAHSNPVASSAASSVANDSDHRKVTATKMMDHSRDSAKSNDRAHMISKPSWAAMVYKPLLADCPSTMRSNQPDSRDITIDFTRQIETNDHIGCVSAAYHRESDDAMPREDLYHNSLIKSHARRRHDDGSTDEARHWTAQVYKPSSVGGTSNNSEDRDVSVDFGNSQNDSDRYSDLFVNQPKDTFDEWVKQERSRRLVAKKQAHDDDAKRFDEHWQESNKGIENQNKVCRRRKWSLTGCLRQQRVEKKLRHTVDKMCNTPSSSADEEMGL